MLKFLLQVVEILIGINSLFIFSILIVYPFVDLYTSFS